MTNEPGTTKEVIVTCPKCRTDRVWDHKNPICPTCNTPPDHGIACILCDGFVPSGRYGDGECDKCGQSYTYDECVTISLSPQQIEWLRKMSRESS